MLPTGFNGAITDLGTWSKLTVTCVVISGRPPTDSVLLLLFMVKGECDCVSDGKKSKTEFKRHACYFADSSVFFFDLISNSSYI